MANPTRRQWLAASLALAVERPPWNQPVPLGASQVKVTRLAMGCAEVRDPKLLRRAAELGINYFNALPNRGLTDFVLIGQALKPIRPQVVLAGGASQPTRQGMLAQLDNQLRSLDTDYLDLWYLIAKQRPEQISDELLEAVRAAKQAGKIRAAMLSTHGLAAVLPRVLQVRETLTALMVTCNFAAWDGLAADITKVHQAGLGIVAMKPLLAGLASVPEPRRAWAKSLDESKRQRVLAAALKWVMRNPQVDTVPVTMTSFEQLERNVQAASEAFTEADQQLLVLLR